MHSLETMISSVLRWRTCGASGDGGERRHMLRTLEVRWCRDLFSRRPKVPLQLPQVHFAVAADVAITNQEVVVA